MIKQANKLSQKINELLDREQYDKAKEKLDDELKKYQTSGVSNPFLLAEIAGFFIDVGSENWDFEAAKKGVEILEENSELFKTRMTAESYYYCLGNGKEALHRIEHYKKGLPTLEIIKPDLVEAKNNLLRAFKEGAAKGESPLSIKVLTNLAGNLAQTGRVVDSIRLYQTVLRRTPQFPQALIGLAENLDYWATISGCAHTKAFYSLIYLNYESGLRNGNIPPIIKEGILEKHAAYKEKILELGISMKNLPEEFSEIDKEYETHSAYRKFCLDRYLTLNEHAIYCTCKEASQDNLSIGHDRIAVTGNKVPKMELLLNRLKAEFGLARKLFFESLTRKTEDEIVYNELGDNEVINESSEKLRTSFKLCFGIFDKIAHGICFFYELVDNPKENIYFNTFWENNAKRWEKIRFMRNPHLVALYSISNDLNVKNGEFGFYKEWRNGLEHNLIVLTDNDSNTDPFQIFSEKRFVRTVSFDFFQSQALLLLQLCRTAIFSFTYAIRMETIKTIPETGNPSYVIRPKEN